MPKSYKDQFTFTERRDESNRILSKYIDRIPIIIECTDKELDNIIKKKKFLVPCDISASYLLHIIRDRAKIDSKKALLMFVDNILITSSSLMIQIYENYLNNKKEELEDKFLYITLSYENTFGF